MEYHKIQSIYKRDPTTKHKTMLFGEYSIPEFAFLKDNEWDFTEKVDGTNIRVYHNPEMGGFDANGRISPVSFGGRTANAQLPVRLANKLNEMFPWQLFEEADFGKTDLVLYGEGYGAKIQKGGGNYIPDGVSFVLFDIKIGDWWLQREDVLEIGQKLGLAVVPLIGTGTLDGMVSIVESGLKSIWGDFYAEGIVARPSLELKNRAGHRIITKLKHKDFPR